MAGKSRGSTLVDVLPANPGSKERPLFKERLQSPFDLTRSSLDHARSPGPGDNKGPSTRSLW
ncbi:MAG: hypothetical protein J0I20_29465 [Chloroflexi bacterium]|nr:hypothetical protein [Chloroflexota bacterium]OJV95990.1 MAG: hypothetical protein BGO39_03925 [Chloroflexi bacterium 54-19]